MYEMKEEVAEVASEYIYEFGLQDALETLANILNENDVYEFYESEVEMDDAIYLYENPNPKKIAEFYMVNLIKTLYDCHRGYDWFKYKGSEFGEVESALFEIQDYLNKTADKPLKTSKYMKKRVDELITIFKEKK